MANETYTLIQKTTLNASAASITFSSIPQTFTDLVVKVSGKPSGGGTGGLGVQFNNTTTTYTNRRLYGDGSGAASDSAAITNYLNVGLFGNATGSNNFGSTEIYIPNYTSSNQKSVSTDSVAEGNSATQYMTLQAGLWNGTSAITSIKLAIDNGAADFVTNTTVSLYGVAKQGVTPTGIPKASGGDIITNDGTYWIHQFLTSGTFTPSQSLTADYLLIGGGGGAASALSSGGGGGGAGGYRNLTAQSLTAQSYAVSVGAGGVGGNQTAAAVSGTASVFNSLSAAGGGFAGRGTTQENGGAGGSGGGCGALASARSGAIYYLGGAGNTPSTSPSQGNAGGNGQASTNDGAAGGGGGAGAAGTAGVSGTVGAGGAGAASSITGTSVTRAGGGGGGATAGGPAAASGGTGGGGAGGAYNTAGTAGSINTGGGAGGSGQDFTGSGAAGGSGIVIIRYAM